MTWIKFEHTLGTVRINLDNVYTIVESSPTNLTFYDNNSILPVTYTFSSAQDLSNFVSQIESVIRCINIDQLAPQ
jgi:hypothetical protein